jgi:hypothetical protein
MQTYPILNTSGELYAFEIDLLLISASTVGRLMRSKLGATITPRPRKFYSNNDVRLGFVLQGVHFIVVEPFGDNSRYWVGPYAEDGARNPLIDQVHELLKEYRPTLMGWLRTFKGNHSAA